MASTCPSCTASPVCVCVCVWAAGCASTYTVSIYVFASFCSCVCLVCIFACLLCAFFTDAWCDTVCVCVHCADWAGVLAIRKTTSGKVHINHVPQLKERNGAEMGRGREGGGERIMRDVSEAFRAAPSHCLL